jgi:hypothetical protein
MKSYIQNDADTIERFRKLNTKDEYYTSQIEYKLLKNTDRENEIIILKKRILDVEKGVFDRELIDTEKVILEEISIKKEENKRKKEEEIQQKKAGIMMAKTFEQSGRRTDRNVQYNNREIEKSWQYFVKSKDSIPDYILKKLKSMPNNKGYIWKNIYCFGERPASIHEPIILFETQKDILVIHETTNSEYKIWHKKGTSKKYLYFSTPRRQLSIASSSFGNYIK